MWPPFRKFSWLNGTVQVGRGWCQTNNDESLQIRIACGSRGNQPPFSQDCRSVRLAHTMADEITFLIEVVVDGSMA